jgi:hypothetical protein
LRAGRLPGGLDSRWYLLLCTHTHNSGEYY